MKLPASTEKSQQRPTTGVDYNQQLFGKGGAFEEIVNQKLLEEKLISNELIFLLNDVACNLSILGDQLIEGLFYDVVPFRRFLQNPNEPGLFIGSHNVRADLSLLAEKINIIKEALPENITDYLEVDFIFLNNSANVKLGQIATKIFQGEKLDFSNYLDFFQIEYEEVDIDILLNKYPVEHFAELQDGKLLVKTGNILKEIDSYVLSPIAKDQRKIGVYCSDLNQLIKHLGLPKDLKKADIVIEPIDGVNISAFSDLVLKNFPN